MGVRFVATIFGKFLYTFICTVVVKLEELHMHSFVAVQLHSCDNWRRRWGGAKRLMGLPIVLTIVQ